VIWGSFTLTAKWRPIVSKIKLKKMKNPCLLFFTGLVWMAGFACTQQNPDRKMSKTSAPQDRPAYAIAIHGGAGTIRKSDVTPELEAE
jgi:hypothetical protein